MKNTIRYVIGILLLTSVNALLFASQSSVLRAKQDQAIADIRKGDFSVLVIDQDGSNVPACAVKFEQQMHDFHFGNALNYSQFGANKYLDTMAAYFNHFSMQWEFEWPDVEPRRDASLVWTYSDGILNWARSMGMTARAHAIAWGVYDAGVPSWQRTLSNSEILDEMLERVWDIYDHYGDSSFTDYDVVNEQAPDFSDYRGDWYSSRVGWDGIAQVYSLADSLFTGEVYVNEFDLVTCDGGLFENTKDVIDNILSEGGVVQGVGGQAHIIGAYGCNADGELQGQLTEELWTTYGTRFKITEAIFDGSNTTDQADNMEEVLRAAFAHTSCDGFITWGVFQSEMTYSTASYWWSSSWQPRPVVNRYKDLVFDEWWSGNVDETTGSNGIATGDVFYGKYLITVKSPGNEETKTVTATMARKDGSKQITVQLDGEYVPGGPLVKSAESANNRALEVHPKVSADAVEFIIQNGNAYDMNVSVYNIKGEKVWNEKVHHQYKVRWDLNAGRSVSNGAYLVKADNGKHQIQKRFVIAR